MQNISWTFQIWYTVYVLDVITFLILVGSFLYYYYAIWEHQEVHLQLYGEAMVWYNMFIIFVMFCMLPVPVKWCTICCFLTMTIHLLVLAVIYKTSRTQNEPKVRRIFSVLPNCKVMHIYKNVLIIAVYLLQ